MGYPLKKSMLGRLSILVVSLILGGCQGQATELLNSSKSLLRLDNRAKLSSYTFTEQDKFGVLVNFTADSPLTMHQAVMSPLTDQLAVMLNEELGVTGIAINQADFDQWRENQLANRVALEGGKLPPIDESQFFRQAGYRGFMRVTATEILDGASRNDFDFALRTKFALRVLETNDKGEAIAPSLAQFTTVRAVCSRRFRSEDTSTQAARLSEGYKLTNIQRCAATPVYRARVKLAEEKK